MDAAINPFTLWGKLTHLVVGAVALECGRQVAVEGVHQVQVALPVGGKD